MLLKKFHAKSWTFGHLNRFFSGKTVDLDEFENCWNFYNISMELTIWSLQLYLPGILNTLFLGKPRIQINTFTCTTCFIWSRVNLHAIYRIVASRSTSRLVTCLGLFRLLMKGIFGPYVLWPLEKKLIFWIVTRVSARDYTVFIQATFSNSPV